MERGTRGIIMAHYKQKGGYGCGLYSVANALQDESFITPERIEMSKKGNNIGQLNKWLFEDKRDYYIAMLCYNNNNPVDIFDLEPKFENNPSILYYPFFIVIKSTERKNHMIGCGYMRDMSIEVHDSLLNKGITYKDFNSFKKHYDGQILSYEMIHTFSNEPIAVY